MKRRHMYEFGTTQEQFAKLAVNQRFNALTNPMRCFRDNPSPLTTCSVRVWSMIPCTCWNASCPVAVRQPAS